MKKLDNRLCIGLSFLICVRRVISCPSMAMAFEVAIDGPLPGELLMKLSIGKATTMEEIENSPGCVGSIKRCRNEVAAWIESTAICLWRARSTRAKRMEHPPRHQPMTSKIGVVHRTTFPFHLRRKRTLKQAILWQHLHIAPSYRAEQLILLALLTKFVHRRVK